MENIDKFIEEHINDDVTKLILNREKWAGIDMDLAVNTIESRRKLRGKVQLWAETPGLRFPFKLSAEQCSSSFTAQYKAGLAAKIIASSGSASNGTGGQGKCGSDKEGSRKSGKPCGIADLTGGLGVDSWYFSKVADVLYNEMKPRLAEASKHNFAVLGAENITVTNHRIITGCSGAAAQKNPRQSGAVSTEDSGTDISIAGLLQHFPAGLIFLDPARRGEGGRKVFMLEDCSPDVLSLREELLKAARHILLKLSPMADISMVCEKLGGHCREVHVVATGGECKELLIWLDREWSGEYSICVCEEGACFRFGPADEKSAKARYAAELPSAGTFLFEPGKALMKAGAFNLLSEKFGIAKIGKSTHYYFVESVSTAHELTAFGKMYKIIKAAPLNNKSIRDFAAHYPAADLTARNLPFDTDTLRAKMYGKKKSAAPQDSTHIFALKSDSSGNLLIASLPL
ncbi:MAG: hypothetical protein ACI3ZQ_01350 [Candidatus Cryptobacteroides sp.]